MIGMEIAGRFRIEAFLGQGGMGKVYRARHLSLNKSVCLKVLKPALLEDPTLVGRFEREALAASRLNHPNAIQVLDFGRVSAEGTLYIAMEYVQGKDLRVILRDDGPLPEERLVRVVAQVLAALGEAHAHNVIHRDLKPENIMVEARLEQPDFVKVLDFGIAKVMDADLPGLTRSDVVCGTPQYMAPEQATGSTLDARCDLYAVGVILYQLATGTLPFDGHNSMEVLTRQVNDAPERPRKRAPLAKISRPMERLILRALEKDPAARPQTATEFRKLLLEIPEQSRAEQEAAQQGPATEPETTPPASPAVPTAVIAAPTTIAAGNARRAWQMPAAALGAVAIAASGLLLFNRLHTNDLPAHRDAIDAGAAPAELIGTQNIGTPTNRPEGTPAGASGRTPREQQKASLLVEQAHQLQRDGDTGSARDLLEQAIAIDPDNARAHYSLGGLYLYTQPERARTEYDLSVRLDPATYAAQVKSIEATLPAKRP